MKVNFLTAGLTKSEVAPKIMGLNHYPFFNHQQTNLPNLWGWLDSGLGFSNDDNDNDGSKDPLKLCSVCQPKSLLLYI